MSADDYSHREIWSLGLLTASTGLAAHLKMAWDVVLVGRSSGGEMAAFAFAFPAMLIFTSLSQAFYIATSATFTRDNLVRNGCVDATAMKRFMAMYFAVGIIAAGVFRLCLPMFLVLLGADSIAPFVVEYCNIWLWSVPMLLVSSASFSILRTLGLIRTASMITLASVAISASASTMFIGQPVFGYPLRAIEAAAYSTVLFSFISFGSALFIVMRKAHKGVSSSEEVGRELRVFARVAIPVFATNLINILYLSTITRIFAQTGRDGLAVLGLVDRYEQLLLALQMGFVAVTTPALKSRYSTGSASEINPVSSRTVQVMLSSSLLAAVLAISLGSFLAFRLIAPVTIATSATFAMIAISISCGFQGIFFLLSVMLNLRGYTGYALLWSVVRAFGIVVPLAFVGRTLGGPNYVFAFIAFGHIAVGLLSVAFIKRVDATKRALLV
ncbi:hypothetical protein [Rhodanobacter sp. C05]|uniref:hypothetical protein n=1 Tax=Rhodanobacter sp. C05 TaxID=1945855 RepID=UPI000984F54A|nr:hypothetical protein [Rhodanobacter sp. C05]OOG43468.1 hypothetical protein B0E51_01265 [Rhodanobacter sp. C05]